MLEVLKFIFSSFWVWSGTVILVAVTGGLMTSTAACVFQRHD